MYKHIKNLKNDSTLRRYVFLQLALVLLTALCEPPRKRQPKRDESGLTDTSAEDEIGIDADSRSFGHKFSRIALKWWCGRLMHKLKRWTSQHRK
jgi:hypothetical protein